MDKSCTHEFLLEHNLPCNTIIQEWMDPQDISFSGLPDFFVLKPANLWSGRGVMLLRRVASDTYYDDMTKKEMSSPEIRSSLDSVKAGAHRQTMRVIAESRAIDEDESLPIPIDYKLFTFFGNVEFILQIDRNHETPKLSFFDGKFMPMNDDRVYFPPGEESQAGIHRRPQCSDQLITLASDLSTLLKAPFVSIDCYATNSGAVIGELTHTPGGPWHGEMYRFSDAFDKRLGQAWHDALRRLGRETQLVEDSYDIALEGRVVRRVTR